MSCTLYLGFEGVLHPADVFFPEGGTPYLKAPGHLLFENSAQVASVVDEVPDVRIVLNTWWVRLVGYRDAVNRLPTSVQTHVVGATFPGTRLSRFRRQPIASRATWLDNDLKRRQPTSVVVLDYDIRQVPVRIQHAAFIVDPRIGLGTSQQCERLVAVLRRNAIGCKQRGMRQVEGAKITAQPLNLR